MVFFQFLIIKKLWKNDIFKKRVKKIAPYFLHIFMVVLVILYTIIGAIIIKYLERKRKVDVENKNENFSKINNNFSTNADLYEYWSTQEAVIFAFSIITTIGYGNVAPITPNGRLFVLFYGLIGVPLALIVMANLGKFISAFLKKCTQKFMSVLKKSGHYIVIDETVYEKVYSVECSLFIAFLFYIFIGGIFLSSYEPEMDAFEAIYFNFITLTTIGLGDIVPKREKQFLIITLIYITIGLALTTIAIEIAADYLRKLHWFGRKVENVSQINIWFGGKKLTVRQFVKNLSDQLNLDMDVVNQLNLDNFVENAIQVEAGERPSLRCMHIKPIKPIIATDFRDIYSEDQIMWIDEDEFVTVYTFKKRMELYSL